MHTLFCFALVSVIFLNEYAAAQTAPILIAPSNHATGVRLDANFIWTSSVGAISYELQVSADSTFSSAVIGISNVQDTTVSSTALQHRTIYYWRVTALYAEGLNARSAVFNFRTRVASVIEVGEVQASSASIILRYVSGMSVLVGDELEWADASEDGTVSAYDAALVLRAAAGL